MIVAGRRRNPGGNALACGRSPSAPHPQRGAEGRQGRPDGPFRASARAHARKALGHHRSPGEMRKVHGVLRHDRSSATRSRERVVRKPDARATSGRSRITAASHEPGRPSLGGESKTRGRHRGRGGSRQGFKTRRNKQTNNSSQRDQVMRSHKKVGRADH